MIHTSIGEDSKILDTDEEPTPAGLFDKFSRNPDELEEESFLTKAKREWDATCKKHPGGINSYDRTILIMAATPLGLRLPAGFHCFRRSLATHARLARTLALHYVFKRGYRTWGANFLAGRSATDRKACRRGAGLRDGVLAPLPFSPLRRRPSRTARHRRVHRPSPPRPPRDPPRPPCAAGPVRYPR